MPLTRQLDSDWLIICRLFERICMTDDCQALRQSCEYYLQNVSLSCFSAEPLKMGPKWLNHEWLVFAGSPPLETIKNTNYVHSSVSLIPQFMWICFPSISLANEWSTVADPGKGPEKNAKNRERGKNIESGLAAPLPLRLDPSLVELM